MNKIIFAPLILVLSLFLISPFEAAGQARDPMLVLDELIQKVVTQNPELQSSFQGWEASKTQITQQEALPDPTVGLNLMNIPVNSFTLDQEPMTGKQISLMQPFPFPGTLSLKGDIARSSSDITLHQHQELKNQLIKKTKQAYYDLYYIDQALTTVTDNQEVLKEFVKIAETRYGVGKGLQQDVLRAQVALSKMIDRELKLRQQREAIQAQINTLINEPADAPLGKALASEPEPWRYELTTLIQQADSTSPMLAAWKTVVKQSGQQVDLALKNRYPDFAVGVAYTQRNELQNGMPGYDFISAMFNVKIPLFHKKKQAKKVQETRIRKSSMEYRYRNLTNSIEQMLQQSLTNLEKNRRLIDLYKTGIIPQAEESLESSMAGYQNDKVDFLSLLDSELTLFQFRLDYHRFLADYHKALAEIEALTGTEF
ncbi:TolC family protein [Fodinibius sediminis]|uniref:Outer membrane protein TolC n=1 Tax=Fodinibius sediminis TaxID=1214077 RepID=A0A521F031_9BACT|nr:TolC family protein [Fodinibius sediminis]SMO89564.1 Outer membrane protein TolC [Fodinibius sediminis]